MSTEEAQKPETAPEPEAGPVTITPDDWQAEVLAARARALNAAQQAFDAAVAKLCVENGQPANLPMAWDGKTLTERQPKLVKPQ